MNMDLTDFRADLTEVIDNLPSTGPLRLAKYGVVVAEIRSADPAAERAYTETWFDLLTKFGKEETLGHLINAGIDSYTDLRELYLRHEELEKSGVEFDPYPEHCLPSDGTQLTVDQALAVLYFGDERPADLDDSYEWFMACADLQRAAHELGVSTKLPVPNAYDESMPCFVDFAIASAHTPETLRVFGRQALEQGVALDKLDEMMGKDAIPADVLAMEHYSSYTFENLVKAGLPHAEAVALFRRGRVTKEMQLFVGAGLRTADEIGQVVADGISATLASRAHDAGYAPDQWRIVVPNLQKARYQEYGLLPFALLVEAAEEGVSLVRWDNATLPVDEDHQRRYTVEQTSRRNWRTGLYPWVQVFPERVLDLARAGILPGYVAAVGKLLRHEYETGGKFLIDALLTLKAKGLTTDMAKAMMRTNGNSKKPVFTFDQLVAVLDATPSLSVSQISYLVDGHENPADWVTTIRTWEALQPHMISFVTRQADSKAWATVQAYAASQKVRRERWDRNVVLNEAADLMATPEKLTSVHLSQLLFSAHYNLTGTLTRHTLYYQEHRDMEPVLKELMLDLKAVINEHKPV